MYIALNDVLFLLALFILVFIVYRRSSYNDDLFGPIGKKYQSIDRKFRLSKYVKQVNKQPADSQKILFKEVLVLVAVLFLMFVLATKAVFFTAVVSGSMSPTFNKYDLVLMQNAEHSYQPGDIIMFKRPDTGQPYTHRIKFITDSGVIRTQGDATTQMDWWELRNGDILGKAIVVQGKPIVIKGYGKYFILETQNQDLGIFGKDYRKYQLFFQVVKLYGYVIAVFSLLLYIVLTVRQKPRQIR